MRGRPSKIHDSVLDSAIEEYVRKGYELISKDRRLPQLPSYAPDAFLENSEEIVILEVIYTSDRTEKYDLLHGLFDKPIRLDKREIAILFPDEVFTSLHIRKKTKRLLRKMQGEIQGRSDEKITVDICVNELIRFWHEWKHLEEGK